MASRGGGTLSVEVKEGRKLSSNGGGARVVVQFEKQDVSTQSAANEDDRAPSWNESFKFDVTDTNSNITLTVVDKDEVFLGLVQVSIATLSAGSVHEQWLQLVPRVAKEKIKGEILVRFELDSSALSRKMSVDDFQLLAMLGKGSFGKVMQVRKLDTGRIYAMKILNKSTVIERDEVEHTRAEQRVLGMINHPFIVGLKFSFQTPAKLYLVLDYIRGGELFYHLQNEVKFAPERCQFYAAELTLAIEYLHSLDIVYRDLKPENILIDHTGHMCITDFGLCKEGMNESALTETFCGTAEYLAPEVLKGDGYGKAVDWWSLGILLYEMLVGLPPFYSDNTNLMYKKIMYSELKFPDEITPECQDLIAKLLDRNAATRLGSGPTGSEEIKRHPYFANIKWQRLFARQITPPWVPPLQSETDTTQFDPTFTSQAPVDSPVEETAIAAAADFSGFTYEDKSELAVAADQER